MDSRRINLQDGYYYLPTTNESSTGDFNRLLAMSTKDVNVVFIDYVKEAKLIEMAVQLMVAYERVMVPSTLKSKRGIVVKAGTIPHNFMGEIECQIEEREASVCMAKRVALWSRCATVKGRQHRCLH